jgi:5'-deoxynucleotidase YfbR-like HD superfamily hydrolase
MTTDNLTDEYILSEIEKLLYPYGLNRVIRYNLARTEEFQTQSVAEHVANMIFLAHYFRDFEDPRHELDFEKVIKLIMMHDMGEIETGDIIAVAKNQNHEILERKAITLVKEKSPKFIADEIETLYEEFENPKTQEGKYANPIDKFEGQIYWMEKKGVEMVIHAHKSAGLETKIVHPIHMKKVFTMLDTYNFPIIKRFLEVIEKKKYSYGIIK